ncbi:MAG TPA: phage protease, partial [Candidatus Cloacimonadota bacterium]|nr:phage protease [Candidatus Cloacimonadota bacterium]
MKKIEEVIKAQSLIFARTCDFQANAMDNGRMELVVSVEGYWAARDMEVTAQRHAEMLKTFTDEGKDLLFDYDHEGIFGMSSRAAAWGKSMRIEGDKLIVEIEPTGSGLNAITNKEFRYLSPVYQYRWYNKRTGEIYNTWRLHSVALTNVPFIEELPAITNTENAQGERMDKLLQLLGANDEASAIAKVEEIQANNLKLEADVSAMTVKINAQEVDAAINSGKLLPAQKELANKLINNDRALYDEFIANSVPVKNVTTEVPLPAGDPQNKDTEINSYKQLLDD